MTATVVAHTGDGQAVPLEDGHVTVVLQEAKEDRLLTVRQAAEALGRHVQTVYLMCKHGELDYVRLGPRSVRIRRSEIDRCIAHGPRRKRSA